MFHSLRVNSGMGTSLVTAQIKRDSVIECDLMCLTSKPQSSTKSNIPLWEKQIIYSFPCHILYSIDKQTLLNLLFSCLPVSSSNSFWDSNMMMSAAAAAAVAAANAAHSSSSLHHQQQHHMSHLQHSMHQLPLHPMPPASPEPSR